MQCFQDCMKHSPTGYILVHKTNLKKSQSVFFDYCCCSVAKSCPTLCGPMDCSMPGCRVLHYLPEFAQTHVHWVNDATQPFHLPLPASLPALNLSRHNGPFQLVGSLHQVAKVLELQLQYQSFPWIFRIDFLYDWLVWSSCCPRDSQEFSPSPQFKSII